MNPRCGTILALAAVLACFGTGQASAQVSASDLTSSDRLFVAFAEDATIIQKQWWEGQVELDNYPHGVDATILRGVVAFQPWQDVEIGGRMGFGDTDGFPGSGSGGTDLDLWGKYLLGSDANATDFAVGGSITVPTGDDSAGLGADSFGAGVFGALRYKLPRWVLSAHAGVRMNGDGQGPGGAQLDGQTSFQVGVGGLVPLVKQLTGVGEVSYESERFDGADADFRVLGGVNWHVGQRGTVRGAVSFGLDDGAPDAQVLASYAARF